MGDVEVRIAVQSSLSGSLADKERGDCLIEASKIKRSEAEPCRVSSVAASAILSALCFCAQLCNP